MENKNTELKLVLRSFGFGDKESSVYFALLELGRGTVTEISRKAGINRTTGYDILASLATKGLVNISGKEPKQEYVTESPDALIRHLEEQSIQLSENIKKAKQIVPELKSMQAMENRPKIKFYEGIEGLKAVYEDTLTATESIRAYAAYEDMHTTLKDYFPSYYKRRAAKGIHGRGIVPRTPMAMERVKHNKEEDRELALVPKDMFDISPEIDIYDNKIMIASWREKLGVIIESKEISDAMKKVFELAWKEAVRLDKDK